MLLTLWTAICCPAAVSTDAGARKASMKVRRADKSEGEGKFVCLVRATDGKKKISCEVGPKEDIKFHVQLSGERQRTPLLPACRQVASPYGCSLNQH